MQKLRVRRQLYRSPKVPPKWIAVLETLGPLLALALVVCGFAIADKIWGSGQFTDIRNLRVVLVMTALLPLPLSE